MKIENRRLMLELEHAQLEASLIRAKLPDTGFKPVEGKFTSSDSIPVAGRAQMQATLGDLAAAVAGRVNGSVPRGARVLLVTPEELSGCWELAAFTSTARMLNDRINGALDAGKDRARVGQPEGSDMKALGGVESALGLLYPALQFVGGIAALFRTDTDVKTLPAGIESSQLAYMVAARLPRDMEIIVPSLAVPTSSYLDDRTREPMRSMDALLVTRGRVLSDLARGRSQCTKAGAKWAASYVPWSKADSTIHLQMIADIDQFLQPYLAIETGSGMNRFARLVRTGSTWSEDREGSVALTVAVGGSHVESRVTQSGWGSGSRNVASHVVGSYVLTSRDGRILAADCIDTHSAKYVREKEELTRRHAGSYTTGGDAKHAANATAQAVP